MMYVKSLLGTDSTNQLKQMSILLKVMWYSCTEKGVVSLLIFYLYVLKVCGKIYRIKIWKCDVVLTSAAICLKFDQSYFFGCLKLTGCGYFRKWILKKIDTGFPYIDYVQVFCNMFALHFWNGSGNYRVSSNSQRLVKFTSCTWIEHWTL